MDTDKAINRFCNANEVLIYGARVIAYGIYTALKEVWGIKTKCFVVTQRENNPVSIDTIPVITISECNEDKNSFLLIATPEPYHQQIIGTLNKLGYTNYLCIDSHLEYEVMSWYFRKMTSFKLLEDMPLHAGDVEEAGLSDIKILMVKSHADLRLKEDYPLDRWILPLQAGAALTDERILDLTDNAGEHISFKNRNYSELTATYWAWKNLRCKYKGIFHYRRVIRMDEAKILQMKRNNVDVVLPLPFVCHYNTRSQYSRYISKEDIQTAFCILHDMEPAYYEASKNVLQDRYIYNYNMLIAKAEVFDDYCKWLFPILAGIEKHYEMRGIIRQDRYIGYIGEVLTAIYFLCNRKRLNIVHGEKKWLI